MATILVADDNSNIQKMVALALKDEGIDVVSVGNGEAAVRRLPEVSPDLVLADIFMPVRNGYEVCEFVKQDARFSHVPVILLVGAFDPLDEHEAQRVGADGVLKKPFVPPEPLINMVKTMLAKFPGVVHEPVPAPVGVAVSSPAAKVPAATSSPAAEPHIDEFGVAPQHVTMEEGEHPLAWSELLKSVEAEPEAPAADAPSKPAPQEDDFAELVGSGLKEGRTWGKPEPANEPEVEKEEHEWGSPDAVLPRREEASLLQHAELEEASPSAEWADPAAPSTEIHQTAEPAQPQPVEHDLAEESTWGKEPLPWGTLEESVSPHAQTSQPETAEPDYHADGIHLESPQPQSIPSGEPAQEDLAGAPPVSAESEFLAPGVYLEEIPTEATPIEGVSTQPATTPSQASIGPNDDLTSFYPGAFIEETPIVLESSVSESDERVETPYAREEREPALTAPPRPAIAPPASVPAPVPSAGAQPAEPPQRARPEVVDEVVAKVLQRLQPELLEAVTRELLKPVAEALVRKELDKK